MLKILKAIAAAAAPPALGIAHALGLTEISLSGLEITILAALNGGLVWVIPNKG